MRNARCREFGLALTAGGDGIRLVHAHDSMTPEGFLEASRLDSASRASFVSGSPDAVLLRHSAHQAYRTPAQKAAVRALLTMPPGAELMVSMPTGCGKSLLFQLYPNFCQAHRPGACVVVITPTIALALDHARTLAGIPGLQNSRAFTGDLNHDERRDLLDAFRRGEIPVLFLSPEFALGAAREALIEAATPSSGKYAGLNAQLKALFIDEAHIIESWGRSFRPDFQRLPALLADLRQRDPSLAIILLSATLTPAAREELRRAYEPSGSWLEIDAQTPRYEFDVVVQSYTTDTQRQSALDQVIDWAPRPLITYTTRVEDANKLHARLRERGYARTALFTGDTKGSDRQKVVGDWAADRLDIVVATSAFGMGIDKSDVRTVIHACLPESPSRWYQEIGRAARDGHQGLAILLFTTNDHAAGRNDVADAFVQATGSWLTREIAERRWRALIEKPGTSHWSDGDVRLTVDLDATHDGLTTRIPNDYNKNWNRSLLNLLQRANVLEIVSVSTEQDVPGSHWEIAIKKPMVLDPDNTAIWDHIFEVRDKEQAAARKEFNDFKSLITQQTNRCLMQTVFALIEGDAEQFVPPCGRCPSCRRKNQEPPTQVRLHGLERAWPDRTDANPFPLPPSITLIAPEDPAYGIGLERLLHRLAAAGFEQFLVPKGLAEQTGRLLVATKAHLGLVLAHNEWVGIASESLPKTPDRCAPANGRSDRFITATPPS